MGDKNWILVYPGPGTNSAPPVGLSRMDQSSTRNPLVCRTAPPMTTLFPMSNTLVECVPNFSEGRDPAKVDAIVEAMKVSGGGSRGLQAPGRGLQMKCGFSRGPFVYAA
jgi:hypothetical protein